MKPDNPAAPTAIAGWLRAELKTPGEPVVTAREEPHCPDPGCPLRRTVLAWTDSAGQARRLVIVKPLAYVRAIDVQRAARLPAVGQEPS